MDMRRCDFDDKNGNISCQLFLLNAPARIYICLYLYIYIDRYIDARML